MSLRIQRVNQLVKEELSQIILREIEFPQNILVTLTRVDTSADLNQAKVYISVMPENRAKKILEVLNKKIYELQKKLNERLKMKFIPKIIFFKEKEILRAGRIEEILENLKNKK